MAKKPPSLKQIWFVSPIVVEEDPNKTQLWPFSSYTPQQEEQLQEAQPRNFREIVAPPARSAVPDDFGFAMMRNNAITYAWRSKKAAEEHAKQQASKNPKTAYGVFSCCDVFETTVPTVIEKIFNEQGELVVREKGNDTGTV